MDDLQTVRNLMLQYEQDDYGEMTTRWATEEQVLLSTVDAGVSDPNGATTLFAVAG